MALWFDDASLSVVFASQANSFLNRFADGAVYPHSMKYIVAISATHLTESRQTAFYRIASRRLKYAGKQKGPQSLDSRAFLI
jgi:hypothetical protein